MGSFRFLLFLAVCYVATADYRQEALQQHNELRAIHNAPRMTLDSGLSSGADEYARQLYDKFAPKARLKHSPKNSRPGIGENLSVGCTTDREAREGRSVQDGVKEWYDEVCRYNFNRHEYQRGLGHFSQMVWKASTELGIGKYTGRKNGWICTYIVARYRDAGNVNSRQHFRENVERGRFHRNPYCNTVADTSKGDDEFLDAPEESSVE